MSGIKIEFTEGVEDKGRVMLNIKKAWDDLPDNMKNLFKKTGGKIKIFSFKWCEKNPLERTCQTGAGQCKENPNMIDIEMMEHLPASSYRHELTHSYDFIKKISLTNHDPNNEGIEWIRIANVAYMEGSESPKSYPDCKTDYNGPKNGIVNLYGNWNWLEDRATFTQAVYNNPYIFIRLMNPKYICCYDERYRKKLDLALSQGIISEKEYDTVMKLADGRLSKEDYCKGSYT